MRAVRLDRDVEGLAVTQLPISGTAALARAPPLLLFHLTTCLILVRPAAVLRRWTLDARYQRQLVRADDGGTIGLDYFRGAETADGIPIGAPVLLVLHGVTGAPLNPDSIP